MKMRIDQLTPCMTRKGDAISNYILEIRKFLQMEGFPSDIYCEYDDLALSTFIKNYPHCKPSKWDIVIFHASVGSPLTDFFKNLNCIKIMIYHNYTPSHFFKGINEELTGLLENYSDELKLLIGHVDCVLCDSEFNKQHIEQLGFKNAKVSPIFVNFDRFLEVNQEIIKKFSDGFVNILYVGRIIPNKKVEDVIKTFYYYNIFINSKSRLFLVGSICNDAKIYYESLVRYVQKLGLKNVYFTDNVTNRDLAAYYKVSHLFLIMSEHEGMCLPLLEAMHHDIPILAYNAAAVPYTLGDASILIKQKNFRKIAELIDLILHDRKLKNKIIETQQERLKYFDSEKLKKQFLQYIKQVNNLPTKKVLSSNLKNSLFRRFSFYKNNSKKTALPNHNINNNTHLFQHPESIKEIKILYVQPKGVGDIIMSTPILRALKKKYPFASIDFAAEDYCKDIIIGNPNVNEVFSFNDLPNLQEYTLVLRPYLKTQYMVDWQNTGIHIVDLYASLCGIELNNYKTEIIPEKVNLEDHAIKEDYICLHTTSTQKEKDWPYFNELIEKLKDEFTLVVIDDKQHNFPNTIQLPENMKLREKAYIISKSKMLIGIDSMGIHIACAFNIPTIAIYGNTLPELCRPLSNNNLITIKPKKRCTEGWHHKCKEGEYCINSISVDDVLKKIEVLLPKCKIS